MPASKLHLHQINNWFGLCCNAFFILPYGIGKEKVPEMQLALLKKGKENETRLNFVKQLSMTRYDPKFESSKGIFIHHQVFFNSWVYLHIIFHSSTNEDHFVGTFLAFCFIFRTSCRRISVDVFNSSRWYDAQNFGKFGQPCMRKEK